MKSRLFVFGFTLSILLLLGSTGPVHAQGSMEVTGTWISAHTTAVQMKVSGLSTPLKWHVRYVSAYSCISGKTIKDESDLRHRFGQPDDQNMFNEMNCGSIEYSAKDASGNQVSQVVHITADTTSGSLTTGGTVQGTGTTSTSTSTSRCTFYGGETPGEKFVQVMTGCLNIRTDHDSSQNNIKAKATRASRLTWISTFLAGNFPWYQIKLPDGTTGWMAGAQYSKVTQ